MNIGGGQIRGALFIFFAVKKCLSCIFQVLLSVSKITLFWLFRFYEIVLLRSQKNFCFIRTIKIVKLFYWCLCMIFLKKICVFVKKVIFLCLFKLDAFHIRALAEKKWILLFIASLFDPLNKSIARLQVHHKSGWLVRENNFLKQV